MIDDFDNNTPYLTNEYCWPLSMPSTQAPIHLCNLGFYRLPPYHKGRAAMLKKKVILWWGLGGEGFILSNNDKFLLKRSFALITFPNEKISHASAEQSFEYASVAFNGPLALPILESLGLKRVTAIQNDFPEKDFEQLKLFFQDPSPNSELLATYIVYKLLLHLKQNKLDLPQQDIASQAENLIKKNWSSSSFNMEALSRELRIHPSRLSKIFTLKKGIAPHQYLSNIRIQNSLYLIKFSNKKITEISKICGYADPDYFSRIFKQKQKKTPLQYRKDYSSEIA